MKKNKEIEKLLLNDTSYESIVKSKMEQEFTNELNRAKAIHKKVFFDIKKVPKERIFSKDAVYSVINKTSKTKSYINGIQAEGYLGSQTIVREKLLSGEADSFVNGNIFVKFVKIKI